MNDITHPVCLDDKRDPHPDRAARLKAAPPMPQQEMQQLMRACHENPSVRAAVVTHARTQLADQAAPPTPCRSHENAQAAARQTS
jgi:hypothetical protein